MFLRLSRSVLVLLLIMIHGVGLRGEDASGPTAVINSAMRDGWKRQEIRPAARCSDETFVRRIYLDLAGRIPVVDETREFLADDREDKRARLVDSLLASEDYAQHYADVFDTILMGRASEQKYAERVRHGWRNYLLSVFRDNRPWDDVAREILLARPSDTQRAGAVWFLYERNNQHQAIAEAVAPAVFGFRIECAQCHDHMMADEIKQAHYWGLVAFFNRGKNQSTPNGPRVAESAIGGFSEFANLDGDSTPNLLSFLGASRVEETRPKKDEKQEDVDDLYVPASVQGDPKEPKFSRRKKFVSGVLNGHPLLARAMVNRIWAIAMGRGIVHPHDEIDSMHPPSHPELLDWLSEDFAASDFDIRRLVRSIVLSDAYQLQSQRPNPTASPSSFAWYLERELTAEQLARSVHVAMHGKYESETPLIGGLRQQFQDVLPEQIDVSINDALYLANGKTLDRYLREDRKETDLISRAIATASDADRAELLFQSVFSRRPDDLERQALAEYRAPRKGNPEETLVQMVWAMLTSAEFCFNH